MEFILYNYSVLVFYVCILYCWEQEILLKALGNKKVFKLIQQLQIYSVCFPAKPEAPSLSIPSAIVEDLTPSHPFICESNVGYPHGELSLNMRLHNDTDFYPVPYNVSTQEEDLNCSALIRKSFRFEPGLEHNGMELQCAVSNPVTLPLGFNLVATKTIHVVPSKTPAFPDFLFSLSCLLCLFLSKEENYTSFPFLFVFVDVDCSFRSK